MGLLLYPAGAALDSQGASIKGGVEKRTPALKGSDKKEGKGGDFPGGAVG